MRGRPFSASVAKASWGTTLAFLLVDASLLTGAEVDVSKLPPPAAVQIEFDRDIRPIFEQSCHRCHGPERPRSGFRLDSRAAALKGGDYGVDIIPGQSAQSPLIHYVAQLVEEMEMPPKGKGDPLTAQQIALLRAWIDQGVNWSDQDTTGPKLAFSITPTIRWITVDGNERVFREHTWLQDGWSGGFQDFKLRQQLSEETALEAEGRVFFNAHDYRLQLGVNRRDFGFARFGVEQYRRHYGNAGGYFAPFATNAFLLDQDLHLDLGRVWLELGLTQPKWPRLTLGYEYQYREGAKSMLHWSDVFDAAGESAAIYPASKEIDERTHVIRLNASHEVNGVLIEDNFRAEFYDLDSRRFNRGAFGVGEPLPDFASRATEEHDHFHAVNTFRLEKQLRDWLFLSGGYLYSHLEGDAAFSLLSFMPSDPSVILFAGEASPQITLERRSHVLNFNTALGPWDGLFFTGGLQNEWTRDEGLGEAFVPGFPSPHPKLYSSNRDKIVTEENFGVRYTKIPWTVLYAETRFQQEGIDHFEEQFVNDQFGDAQDFLRNTDATSDLKEYRSGFTVSPWTRLALHANYRHRLKQNDFDHEADLDGSSMPGNGYSAFIRSRDIQSDEIEARVVVRAANWIKTTLRYQLLATDYLTATDPNTLTVFDPVTFLPMEVSLPGGGLVAGNHDAHVYSLNATLTPWKRLYLSSTLSFTDSRIVSGIRGSPNLAPYEGDVLSAVSSANFALNNTTDWHASYSFSRADYRQDRAPASFPIGIRYDRHGLVAGITKRLKKNITTTLQYGWFRYDEPTSGGVNDYQAHAVFASMNVLLP